MEEPDVRSTSQWLDSIYLHLKLCFSTSNKSSIHCLLFLSTKKEILGFLAATYCIMSSTKSEISFLEEWSQVLSAKWTFRDTQTNCQTACGKLRYSWQGFTAFWHIAY